MQLNPIKNSFCSKNCLCNFQKVASTLRFQAKIQDSFMKKMKHKHRENVLKLELTSITTKNSSKVWKVNLGTPVCICTMQVSRTFELSSFVKKHTTSVDVPVLYFWATSLVCIFRDLKRQCKFRHQNLALSKHLKNKRATNTDLVKSFTSVESSSDIEHFT